MLTQGEERCPQFSDRERFLKSEGVGQRMDLNVFALDEGLVMRESIVKTRWDWERARFGRFFSTDLNGTLCLLLQSDDAFHTAESRWSVPSLGVSSRTPDEVRGTILRCWPALKWKFCKFRLLAVPSMLILEQQDGE